MGFLGMNEGMVADCWLQEVLSGIEVNAMLDVETRLLKKEKRTTLLSSFLYDSEVLHRGKLCQKEKTKTDRRQQHVFQYVVLLRSHPE